MSCKTLFVLLSIALLAQAAPAAHSAPKPTPAPASDEQSGALGMIFGNGPMDNAILQAYCGKHGCAGFSKDNKRGITALGGAGLDAGTGSPAAAGDPAADESGAFDLAPDLNGTIEGLRDQDAPDGVFDAGLGDGGAAPAPTVAVPSIDVLPTVAVAAPSIDVLPTVAVAPVDVLPAVAASPIDVLPTAVF